MSSVWVQIETAGLKRLCPYKWYGLCLLAITDAITVGLGDDLSTVQQNIDSAQPVTSHTGHVYEL
jgi:hypothetical protein